MRVSVSGPSKARLDAFALMDSIFLVAMVFFYLILSMTRHYGIGVELPSSNTAASNEQKYIAVSVNADDRVFLNGGPVPPEELTRRLNELPERERPVFLEADQSTSYRAVMQTLDAIRRAGLEDVSLEAKHASPR